MFCDGAMAAWPDALRISPYIGLNFAVFGAMSGPEAGEAQPPKSPDDRPSRVVITDNDLENLTVAEFANRWRLQDSYVNALERRLAQQEGRYW